MFNLTLRLDPADARAAGWNVEIIPDSNHVCDFCDGPVAHEIHTKPMPFAGHDNTLLYYSGDWRFCEDCHELRDNDPELFARVYRNLKRKAYMGGAEALRLAFASAGCLCSAFKYSSEPYRTDAVERLTKRLQEWKQNPPASEPGEPPTLLIAHATGETTEIAFVDASDPLDGAGIPEAA